MTAPPAAGLRPPTRRSVLLGGVAAGAAMLSPLVAWALPASAADHLARRPAAAVRFGVNYTPSKSWWFLWQHWDKGAVDRDLRQIAGLGLDHIRVQVLWSVFQPTPTTVDKASLDHLEELLDIAGRRGLAVTVSVLTSSLSGLSFVPRWVTRNYVTDLATVHAEEVLFRAVGARVGRHRALMGFDVGNELLGNAPVSSPTALKAWLGRLLHLCDLVAPGKTHTVSPRGETRVPYPDLVAGLGDVSVIHPWVFDAGSATRGRLNVLAVHQATYNAELVKSFHDYSQPGVRRQVWVQEFGAPDVNFARQRVLPPPLHARFLTETCRALLDRGDLFGITWWCSHDLPNRISAGFREPERHLGLFDASGRPKPTALALAQVASGAASLVPAAARLPHAPVGRHDRDGFEHLIRTRRLPVVVPDEGFHDAAYLKLRGVGDEAEPAAAAAHGGADPG